MVNILKAVIIILAFILVMRFVMLYAHASTACPTISEARATYPKSHLYWHGRAHCWDANPGRKFKGAAKKPSPKPIRGDDANGNKAEKIQPPQQRGTTIWPMLITNVAAVDPQWFTSEHSTEWPRLLDVDELTSDAAPPDCCWPALEQQVAFNDRWQEVPNEWQSKSKGEALWTIPLQGQRPAR